GTPTDEIENPSSRRRQLRPSPVPEGPEGYSKSQGPGSLGSRTEPFRLTSASAPETHSPGGRIRKPFPSRGSLGKFCCNICFFHRPCRNIPYAHTLEP